MIVTTGLLTWDIDLDEQRLRLVTPAARTYQYQRFFNEAGEPNCYADTPKDSDGYAPATIGPVVVGKTLDVVYPDGTRMGGTKVVRVSTPA